MNCSRCRQPAPTLYSGACEICAENMYNEQQADEAQRWLAEHPQATEVPSENLPF